MPSIVSERSVLKTAATYEPITRAEAKLHCRVTHTAEDTYIDNLITMARRQVEHDTDRALITQTWYLYLDRFPANDRIELPRAPLQSITSLKYTDSGNTQTTWSASNYIAHTQATPGELVLAYNTVWPSVTLKPASPIVIEYVAGFGDGASDVPEEYRQAMLLLIGHWYENRQPYITGTIIADVPMTYDRALANAHARWF